MSRACRVVFLFLAPACMATAEPPAPAQPAGPPVIQVVAGSYGENCNQAHGNKTEHLRQECDGKPSCTYKIDYLVIGDPAVGCAKDYLAEWRCGAGAAVRRASAPPEAGFGKIIELRCE
jgi:hypothetical protein